MVETASFSSTDTGNDAPVDQVGGQQPVPPPSFFNAEWSPTVQYSDDAPVFADLIDDGLGSLGYGSSSAADASKRVSSDHANHGTVVSDGLSTDRQLVHLSSPPKRIRAGVHSHRPSKAVSPFKEYGVTVSPLVHQPVHGPTFLHEYWYSRICPIFSTFDSNINPFRHFINGMWHGSSAVYHAMQSMAASCLQEQLPHFGPVALKARGEATRALRRELRNLELTRDQTLAQDAVMACCLLGMSSTWHEAKDLGLVYLGAARNLMTPDPTTGVGLFDNEPGIGPFFREGLVYWEMLAGVLTDDGDSLSAGVLDHDVENWARGRRSSTASAATDGNGLMLPHPWTGIATAPQRLVAQVLRLARQQRNLLRRGQFAHRRDLAKALTGINRAYELEEALLELETPTVESIQETEDERTPRWHFVHMSEAYRVAGLLQLYLTFPDLAQVRLGCQNGRVHEHGDEEPAASLDDWLLSMVIFVLDQLRCIPPTSGTRCTQPLLLVMASSGLWLGGTRSRVEEHSSDDFLISTREVEVARGRSFILDRLYSFARSLPPKPIVTAIKLVREVWSRCDKGEEGVSWIDVMIDCGLETLFG